jgi:hypothetical protein
MLAVFRGKPPRLLWSRPRPKTVLFVALAIVTVLMLMVRAPEGVYEVAPWGGNEPASGQRPLTDDELRAQEEQARQREREEYEAKENALREQWKHEYREAESLAGSNKIYGNTVASLVDKDVRKLEFQEALKEAPGQEVAFTRDHPVYFNPYSDYNSDHWQENGHAPYVPCDGPDGRPVQDILVFKGHPHDWPSPGLGSFDVLNMDGNLCFERDTRWGPYGLVSRNDSDGHPIDWDKVQWGRLQHHCAEKNQNRFKTRAEAQSEKLDKASDSTSESSNDAESTGAPSSSQEQQRQTLAEREGGSSIVKDDSGTTKEQRTAILLRSFTGKKYTENDKQNIRALITELSLRSGGEYQVFLLVHVKEQQEGIDDILDDPEAYQRILHAHVPHEFHDIAVLWDDQQVWRIYTALTDDLERSVHEAQWLSVQKFSREHPEFDYIWNWEMDFRFTGQYYDMLNKLHLFGKKQPRRGLWERNERYYVPSYHGDYDTEFRKMVETRSGKDTVWGPMKLPFLVDAVGPTPPVADPRDDPYEWGVGEDADYITLGPMFNPVGSKWIMWDHVWGYSDEQHDGRDLPRRTTIVTHSRLSKRLLEVMHDEEMRGNHVASEMTPQTVSLLHGLKAVFAPHPVFFDRPWDGNFLQKWFNPGPGGVAGGDGSSMGFGRERRYEGSTWYYRAVPPNRLYNNWMGYPDTSMGGSRWESQHGRPCLPPLMLHPIKDVKPTKDDFETQFDLAFG